LTVRYKTFFEEKSKRKTNFCFYFPIFLCRFTLTMANSSPSPSLALELIKNRLQEFKKPEVPKRMKSKPKILSEDRYIEEMGKIIQRDFFPDLEKLNAQNEYLDALASNDYVRLRKIYAKYSSKSPLLPRRKRSTFIGKSQNILFSNLFSVDSPATFETPIHNHDASTSVTASVRSEKSTTSTQASSKRGLADNHTLDSFLDNYTSEDNQSFQEIIEAADEKLRQKFAILYGEEEKRAAILDRSLALPDIVTQFAPIEGPKTVDTWTYRNKNFIMYTPDGVELTKAEKLEMSKLKMEISHSNTRMKVSPFDDKQNKATISELAKSQAKPNKVGVDGKDVDFGMAPQVRGFNFVKTPSPCPGVSESPLMTWGEIEGTPFRLDGGDTPLRRTTNGPSFHIQTTSKRENLALQLAGAVSDKARAKKQKAIEAARRNIASPQIRNSLERLASMSPAARRLATSKLGISTPSPRRSISSLSKHTPSYSKKATPSPANLVRRKTTPLIGQHQGPGTSNEVASGGDLTLTDNLLSIPNKRAKAADFFK
jgi:protein DGCR14